METLDVVILGRTAEALRVVSVMQIGRAKWMQIFNVIAILHILYYTWPF